jgi:hypothetical protein
MMATLEDEHTDAATHDIPDALTPPQRQSAGPIRHDVYRVLENGDLRLVNDLNSIEVKARGLAGRQKAIDLAVAGLPEDQRGGRFRTVKHGEMSDEITLDFELVKQPRWS